MSHCLCVEVESLPYPVERRDGLDSNMNDYRVYAIGVGV